MLGSNDVLASLYVLSKDAALRFITEWLYTVAPGEPVCLSFTGTLPGFAQATLTLPTHWYYDLTRDLHRPVPGTPNPAHTFRPLTFNYEQLHTEHYIVAGPIPDLPR